MSARFDGGLRATEALVWRLITAPEGVASGLRQHDMKSEELAQVLGGSPRLSALERLDIYANMYFFRLLDVLRGDYTALVAVVGEAAFHNLVTDYLLACPSSSPSVRDVGARLPAFLRGHELATARPWLAELAALERARLEVFDAADAATLTLAALGTKTPDQFVALPLPLVPARALVEVAFSVDEVWRAVENEATPADPQASPRTLVVWRQDLVVYHRALAPLEKEALALAAAGAPFGAVCDLFADEMALEEAGPAAFSMLARWVQDGMIRG